jgi:hypothetical protein
MEIEIVKAYLCRLKDWHGLITTDHLSGWETPKGRVPDHLHGDRFFYYLQGQDARKLRDRDWYTHIISRDYEGGQFSKCFAGRLSHKRIVEICEKAGALDDITAYIVDRATGAQTVREIGY